jgi:DNA-binding MarR family transcriptional regulator
MSFNLDESIGYRVEVTERLLKREWIKLFRKKGIDITPNQWVILYRVNEEEGLTQVEISKRTFKDTANITHIIDLLVKKGFVERVAVESDRRAFKVYLTEKGRSMMEIVPNLVASNIERATQGISKKELEIAKNVLKKICANESPGKVF